MDIYFIFRSNKYRKNNLLTMSYFGSNHAKYISHYFVNIVKTHSYDYNVTNTRKRVRFTKEINLNEIMGLVPRKSALIKVRRRSTSPRRSTTRISRTGSRRSASPKASSPHSRSASPRRSATRRSETRRSSASQKAERKASSPHRTEYLQENMSSNNGIGKGNRKRRTRRRRTSGK